MDEYLHGGSCVVWQTNQPQDCNCHPEPAWMICEEPLNEFPWRVMRRTADGTVEPLMSCSTLMGAAQLVQSFTWLKANGRELRRHGNG